MREWNTPVREPWNALIKQALDGIDRHGTLYLETGDWWHEEKAHQLRVYVAELKTWIHAQERVTI